MAENIINKQEKLVTQSVKVAEQKAAQTELKTKIAQQEGNVKSAKIIAAITKGTFSFSVNIIEIYTIQPNPVNTPNNFFKMFISNLLSI